MLIDIINDIISELSGNVSIIVTTFSTAEEFLRRIFLLRNSGKIKHAVLIADVKAVFKKSQLDGLLFKCFDDVYLCENHSKLVLIANDKYSISVCTSQNQTRGNRLEAGIITTNRDIYNGFYQELQKTIEKTIRYEGH